MVSARPAPTAAVPPVTSPSATEAAVAVWVARTSRSAPEAIAAPVPRRAVVETVERTVAA